MPFEAIQVEGLRQVNAALKEVSRDLQTDLTAGLVHAVEPTRTLAEERALHDISGMKRQRTVRWESMRVGVAGALVYLAPLQRGSKIGPNKRRNLAGLLMRKGMLPAFGRTRSRVESSVGDILERAIRKGGF